jgi:hypothetical protein
MASRITFRPDSEIKVWSYTYRPIANIESYILAQKLNGASEEECNIIRAKNQSVAVPAPTQYNEVPKYDQIVTDPNSVKVSLRIRKDGSVKVSIHNPYEKLFQHIRKCEPVPIGSFVQFHKLNGAPNEYLIRAMNKYDSLMRTKAKDDAKLDAIFERYMPASSTKKKKIQVVKKFAPVF